MNSKEKTYLILGIVLIAAGVIGIIAGISRGVSYGCITVGIALEAMSVNERRKNGGQ